jgi:hypothetical protein
MKKRDAMRKQRPCSVSLLAAAVWKTPPGRAKRNRRDQTWEIGDFE